MANISKQDLQGSRTPADLERRYGQKFSELMGIASDARTTARETEKKFDNMTQEQIFNLLTTDGDAQGIYRDDNGNVYINASYIATGSIKFTKELFIEPGTREALLIMNHVAGTVTIPAEQVPLYDFDGDGVITVMDAMLASQCAEGTRSLADWAGAKKTKFNVSINFFDPENTIHYVGSDMWGRTIDYSLGIGSSFLKMENGGCMYREDGGEKEWLNPPKELQQEYKTSERYKGNVVYTKLLEANFDSGGSRAVTTLIDLSRTIVGINYVFDDGHSVKSASPDVSVSLSVGTGDYYDLFVSVPSYGSCTVEVKYV